MRYAKAIVAVLGAALVVVQAALSDDTITDNEWLKIAIAAVTAAGVYLVPNAQAVAAEHRHTADAERLADRRRDRLT